MFSCHSVLQNHENTIINRKTNIKITSLHHDVPQSHKDIIIDKSFIILTSLIGIQAMLEHQTAKNGAELKWSWTLEDCTVQIDSRVEGVNGMIGN